MEGSSINKNELSNFYTSRSEALQREIERLKNRGKLLVPAMLVEFVGCVALVITYFATNAGEPTLWIAAAMLLAYTATNFADRRNSRIIKAKEALRQVYLGELNYLRGDFSQFDDGTKYIDPHHPFSFDLDIFGASSLYQRVCRCVTTGGWDALAAALSSDVYHPDRGEAIGELSAMEPFRTAFVASANGKTVDCDKIATSLRGLTAIHVPRLFRSKLLRWIVWADIVCYLALCVVAVAVGFQPVALVVWWGVANLCLSILVSYKTLGLIHSLTDQTAKQLDSLTKLITLVEAEDFKAKRLAELKAVLQGASLSFRQMFTMARSLDSRANLIGLLLGNWFVLSDLRLVIKFAQWEQSNSGNVDSWLQAVAQMDILVSMATFRYNEPSATTAEIKDGGKVEIEAKGLWHPFLGIEAVRNDFSVSDGNFYIITGANMAGKSTFLRAMGVNYVLAMNSMPVFAEWFSTTRFNLFTSMRTTDDLTHGISYFNAELLRLKELMENAAHNGPTLIILDEILKGTNSLDKLNGSLLFLRTMLKRPISGIVATHDLELSRLAQEQPDRFHNFCFEIEIGQDITYSYKITPGVARNQNATFLLKKLLEEES